MKKSLLFNLFSLLLLSFLPGCSDEEKIDYGQYVNPNTQVLTVTQNDVTASTFTFSVEAENADIPYVAMHIDKATIESVAKSDLPVYLMGELEAKATVEGVSLEEYLTKVSHKGSISNQKITALTPGSVYELVAFAFTGTEPATKMSSVFFETPIIGKIDCSFGIECTTAKPYVLGFEVTSSATDKDLYYFPVLFYKSNYESQLEISYKDVILNNSFADYWQQATDMSGGDTDKAVEILIKNHILVQDLSEEELTFAGINADYEYKFLIGAYKLLDINGNKELVLVSDVAEIDATTEACNPNDVEAPEYKVTSKYTNEATLAITVTPPANYKGTFAFGVMQDDPSMSDDANELRDLYLYYASSQNLLVESCDKETSVAYVDVHPGTKMRVVVFEYYYGPLSQAMMEVIEVPAPDYNDLAELSVDIKTAYNFDFTLTGGNTSVPYFVTLGNGGDNDLSTNVKVSDYLNNTYQNLKEQTNMDLASFLYGNSEMGYTPALMSIFVGPQEFNSGYLQPLWGNGSYKPYKIYCYPLEATEDETTPIKVHEGLTEESTLQFSSKTAPEFTVKYFTAADASEVFGKEYPESRKMVVMNYYNSASQTIVEEPVEKTYYGVVKDNAGLTMSMDDVDIMYNYNVKWEELPEHKLVFTMCGDNSQYYGLTYVESGTEYSKVARKALLPEGEIDFGTKEELQALYDKAFNPAPVQPSASSIEEYVSPFMREHSIGKDIKLSKKSSSPIMLGKSSNTENEDGRTVSAAKASMIGVAY